MDEDTESILIAGIVFVGLLSIPFLIILSVTTCIAHSRTRQWQKAKDSQSDPESINLVSKDDGSESELDPEDSDDEAELKAREEERNDLTLTRRQKFRKEFVRAWKGGNTVRDAQKIKEREERKKLAKAVAKELAKMERRKQRKATTSDGQEELANGTDGAQENLPSYNTATRERLEKS